MDSQYPPGIPMGLPKYEHLCQLLLSPSLFLHLGGGGLWRTMEIALRLL